MSKLTKNAPIIIPKKSRAIFILQQTRMPFKMMNMTDINNIKDIKSKNYVDKEIRIINVLKGIAIILVLYGHSLQYGSGDFFLVNGFYWENMVMKFIYSFHMPLFMCISGYLFFFSVRKHGLPSSVLRRLKRFMPVLLMCSIMLCILNDIYCGRYFHFKRFLYYALTSFWFLWAIIVCSIGLLLIESIYISLSSCALTSNFVRRVFGRSGGGYYCIVFIVAIALFFITPDFYMLAVYKYMFPYFLVGYLYAKYDVDYIKNNFLGIVTIALWAILLTQYSKESYIYTTGITLLHKENIIHQVYINIFRYLIGIFGVCGCVFLIIRLLSLAQQYHKIFNGTVTLLAKLGSESLKLYILSTYIYDMLLPMITKQINLNYSNGIDYIIILIETIIITIACLCLSEIITLSPILAKWILGTHDK